MPWLLPGYGQQAVLDLKEGAGSDAGVALNPFIRRARLTAQEDVPLFQAQTTQRERWRLMVLDRLTAPTSPPPATSGPTWSPSRPGSPAS